MIREKMISIYITLYSVPFCLHCQIHFHHDYHHHHQSSFFPSKFLIFTLGNCKCLPTPLGGCWQYILCIFQMFSSGGSGPSILLFLIYILRLLLLLLMIDHPDSLAVIDVFLLVFKWKIGCDKILYWGGPKNSAFVNQYVAKCAFSSKYGGGGLNWFFELVGVQFMAFWDSFGWYGSTMAFLSLSTKGLPLQK